MIIAAHRGLHTKEHENTMAAFKSAVDKNIQMIEFDVRRLKDGTLVVIHDPVINEQEISMLNLDDLNGLGLPFPVPTLTEVLKTLKGKTHFDIELKEVGYEKEVVDLAQSEIKISDYIITSFHMFSLLKIRKLNRQVNLGLLISERRILNMLVGPWLFDKIVTNYSSYRLFHRYLDLFASEYLIWNVNNNAQVEYLRAKNRVSAIITDYPLELREEHT